METGSQSQILCGFGVFRTWSRSPRAARRSTRYAAYAGAPVVDWRTFLDLDVRRWWGYYIAMMNRGIAPMATGPDEQWTVSVQHSAADVDAHVAAFDEVAQLLRALRADVHLVESA